MEFLSKLGSVIGVSHGKKAIFKQTQSYVFGSNINSSIESYNLRFAYYALWIYFFLFVSLESISIIIYESRGLVKKFYLYIFRN